MDTVYIDSGSTLTRDISVFSDRADLTPLDISGAVVMPAILDAPNGSPIEGVSPTAGITDASSGQVLLTVDLPAETYTHVYYATVLLTEADSTKTIIDSFKLVVS